MRLGQDGYHMFTQVSHPQTTAIPAFARDLKLKKGSSPDIYVIVLDGYARQDVLQKPWNFGLSLQHSMLYTVPAEDTINWICAGLVPSKSLGTDQRC